LALGVDLLRLKNNCMASCHLNAELIGLSEAAPVTLVEAAACEQRAWDGV
jgi:hypothetical protein